MTRPILPTHSEMARQWTAAPSGSGRSMIWAARAARFVLPVSGRGVPVPEMTPFAVRREGRGPTPSGGVSLEEEIAFRGLALPFLGFVTKRVATRSWGYGQG